MASLRAVQGPHRGAFWFEGGCRAGTVHGLTHPVTEATADAPQKKMATLSPDAVIGVLSIQISPWTLQPGGAISHRRMVTHGELFIAAIRSQMLVVDVSKGNGINRA